MEKEFPKCSLRIRTYGEVDEVNSSIGIASSFCSKNIKLLPFAQKSIKNILLKIQNDLFDIGADLCIPVKRKLSNILKLS